MIRATSEAFLGLTVGCSRCHDHKFDPILTKDYYSLYATFAGTVHGPREMCTAQERERRNELIKPLQEVRNRIVQSKMSIDAEIEKKICRTGDDRDKEMGSAPRASRYETEELFASIECQLVRLKVFGTDSEDPNQKSFKIDEFEIWTDGTDSRNVALSANGAVAIGASPEAKDVSGIYGPQLVNDGKFGERWTASGSELQIKLAKPTRIHRIVFSSDRTKALGEDYHLTTFVGDYLIEVSHDGEHWTQVATSFDRLPPTKVRKAARLSELAMPFDFKRTD